MGVSETQSEMSNLTPSNMTSQRIKIFFFAFNLYK
jgi:hypothetical protein